MPSPVRDLVGDDRKQLTRDSFQPGFIYGNYGPNTETGMESVNEIIRVTLNPTPGFCVKSFTLGEGFFSPYFDDRPNQKQVLEPKPNRVAVGKGIKVFVNIAWDANVPPPPERSEDEIQRATRGDVVDDSKPDGWHVPAIVSGGKQDKDKAGRDSLVFDCVYNSSLKARALRVPEFKFFLIELSLQRIETQTSLELSREIGIPNILSKGSLELRIVSIPFTLFPEKHPAIQEKKTKGEKLGKKSLIEEITTISAASRGGVETPKWSSRTEDSRTIISISVPKITRSLVQRSILELEPNRIILRVPTLYELDISSGSGWEKTAADPESLISPQSTQTPGFRELDVDGARAEWRIAEATIVIIA